MFGITATLIIAGCGGDNGTSPEDSDGSESDNTIHGTPLVYGGQTYRTVIIGGKTWMAENLNYETADSYCYSNSSDSCAKYGRLYTWDAAVTACPDGWSLPSNEEWQTLVDFAGGSSNAGTKLKSKTGWKYDVNGYDGNSTDSYGFSALPGRRRYSGVSGGGFVNAGNIGFWWSNTEYGAYSARYWNMFYYDSNVDESWFGKGYGFSVRCLMD